MLFTSIIPIDAETVADPCTADISISITTGGVAEIEAVESKNSDISIPMPAETRMTITDKPAVFSMQYSEPGDFVYRIKQIPGSDPTMQYDETVYLAEIMIMYDDNGRLQPAVVVKEDNSPEKPAQIVFNNKPKVTPPPNQDNPTNQTSMTQQTASQQSISGQTKSAADTQTSDNFDLSHLFLAIAAGTALIGVLAWTKNKRKESGVNGSNS